MKKDLVMLKEVSSFDFFMIKGLNQKNIPKGFVSSISKSSKSIQGLRHIKNRTPLLSQN
jgi:hypothetical protein